MTLPITVRVFPATVRTDTVPSPRLATSASLPSGLNDTPVGEVPTSRVAITAGGEALRSITVSRLSEVVFFGSVGSILVDAAIRAMLSSGPMATFSGGPTTEFGTLSCPSTLGGDTPRSIMVAVSGRGFSTIWLVPSTLTIWLSLAETAICAQAAGTPGAKGGGARTAGRSCWEEVRRGPSVMVGASRVRVQVSARAMPMRFTGLGHAGRGQCHAEARRDVAEPLSMGMASGAGVARYDTRFRPTRLESCGSERGSPLVIGSDTRQPRLARARGAHRSALGL